MIFRLVLYVYWLYVTDQYEDDEDETEEMTVLERALNEYVALTTRKDEEDIFSEDVTKYENQIRQQVYLAVIVMSLWTMHMWFQDIAHSWFQQKVNTCRIIC